MRIEEHDPGGFGALGPYSISTPFSSISFLTAS
jgi:hypothetical protein